MVSLQTLVANAPRSCDRRRLWVTNEPKYDYCSLFYKY